MPAGTSRDAGRRVGTVSFSLAQLGLAPQPRALSRVRFDCGTDRMTLEAVPTGTRKGTLSARIAVDRREELVLGPAGETQRLFFSAYATAAGTR